MTPDQAVNTFKRIVGPNDKDTLSTPLYPFKKSNGQWWTSQDVADVRNNWAYGFGYPEVPCSRKTNTPTQLDNFATSRINALYKADVRRNKRRANTPEATDKAVLQWNVNALVDQAEVEGTFSIVIFLGQPPADPEEWGVCGQRVGALTILGSIGMKKPSRINAATISLTAALRAMMDTEDEEKVTEYLAKNLDGKSIDVTTLPTLKVGVTNNAVVIPTEDTQKAMFGTPRLRTSVTRRKVGGVIGTEDLTNPKRKDGTRKIVLDRFRRITNTTAPIITTGTGLLKEYDIKIPSRK
ncbi:hypothetical protein ABW20_dc0109441 [Dactylellina cionopaga]|nr:hypothetical protein ABW20_dc0109441 [Dactylellina cionopaga]